MHEGITGSKVLISLVLTPWASAVWSSELPDVSVVFSGFRDPDILHQCVYFTKPGQGQKEV